MCKNSFSKQWQSRSRERYYTSSVSSERGAELPASVCLFFQLCTGWLCFSLLLVSFRRAREADKECIFREYDREINTPFWILNNLGNMRLSTYIYLFYGDNSEGHEELCWSLNELIKLSNSFLLSNRKKDFLRSYSITYSVLMFHLQKTANCNYNSNSWLQF